MDEIEREDTVTEESVTVEDETEVEQEAEEVTEAESDTEDADDADDAEIDAELLKERLRIEREKAERYKAERDRLKERSEQVKDKPEKPKTSDELSVIRLEARGFTRSDEQAEILRAAKSMGITPVEAAEDEYVLAKIERMRRARRAAASIDGPSKGSVTTRKDVDYYIRKGTLPTDSVMLEKVQNELARRAGAGFSRG